MSKYPNSPGYKEMETSLEAAIAIKPSAKRLQDRVYVLLRERPRTADECAALMGVTVLAIRPRVTELKQLGLIRKSGRTGKSMVGRSAHIWEVVP